MPALILRSTASALTTIYESVAPLTCNGYGALLVRVCVLLRGEKRRRRCATAEDFLVARLWAEGDQLLRVSSATDVPPKTDRAARAGEHRPIELVERLVPGMPTDVQIRTESRTALSYLRNPSKTR